ncbi:MAG: hypothetical protein KF799_00640 [Bdellovibrionales bacterium]|nr:hypothetical protein [Bdellovibrionales bacterium]
MSLKDKTLILIEKGDWIFDLIGPLFKGGLTKRIGNGGYDSRSPMMELTLQSYGVASPRLSTLPRSGRFLNMETTAADQRDTLLRLSKSIFPQAVPVSLSSWRKEQVQNAESFMGQHAKQTRQYLEKWISSYLLVENVSFRSASSPHAFGCIFFGKNMDRLDYKNLAVSVVHEMAHQELFLINVLDRLVEESADFSLVHAPFQGIVRPPIGRLHSLYALFRMVEFEKQSGLPHERHQQLIFDTIDSFQDFELTDFARQLVHTIKERTEVEQNHLRVVCLG